MIKESIREEESVGKFCSIKDELLESSMGHCINKISRAY